MIREKKESQKSVFVKTLGMECNDDEEVVSRRRRRTVKKKVHRIRVT